MGFKQLVAVLAIVVFGTLYLVVGSESVSGLIDKYADEKLKDNPDKQEQVMFFNVQYTEFTAKYSRALALLSKYSDRFTKDANRDKAQYMKAKIYDGMLDDRQATEAYKTYIDQFPDGQYISKAKIRYSELKNF